MATNPSAVPSGNGPLHPENRSFDTIPAELRALLQWVCWRYEDRDGKRTKAPIDAKSNGRLLYAKSNDASTWADFHTALAACGIHQELAGVGFCFAPDDGLTGIDLDHVLNPDTGELKPEAAEILAKFQGTYAEISPSGTGLRLFCKGKPGRSGKNTGKTKWLEVYSHPSSRYLTVTGNHWTGNAATVTDQQDALDWLHGRFMESTGGGERQPADSKPAPAVSLNLDDATLLAKARNAKNGAEFERLWSGDTSGHGNDDSAADLALCNLLAFWTDRDSDRMDRLFRRSGLMRPKWDSKRGDTTYGQATIAKAIESTRETYGGRKPEKQQAEAGTAKSGTAPRTRFTAAELLKMTFPDPVWLLPDVLPETGLYLLCGKPKAGKSWFALAVAMALAQGGAFLSRDTPQRKVLYFALEDTPRRLHNRLSLLHPFGSPDDLSELEIRTAAPRLGKGLEDEIRQAAADGFKVVCLDTLQKIRPQASKHGTQYADDYAVLGSIKQVADDCGICIVLVHHVRKAESADDPHDDVSGTNGIAGAADGSLIIRRVHGKPEAVLHVTGREMADNELGLRFENGLWTFAGTAAEVRTTAEQAEIIDALKPYGSEGATVKTVCDDTGKQRRNVAKLLGKLVDAKRVRVRRAKPADFFAVCDGPMSGDTTGSHDSPYRERWERERGENEKHKLSSTGSTGSIGTTGSTGSIPKADGGTAGTGGTLVELEANQTETRLNAGLAGNGGTAGTGGTQNSVEPLAVELAELAGLDVRKMLAGDLSESDWPRLTSASAVLVERHPERTAEIEKLLLDIDGAYSRGTA